MLRSRIAPTPSGYIHLGNLINFIKTWLIVRAANGHLHLRIDDIDFQRYRPEYVADVLDVLKYIGFHYDSGPKSVEDFEKHFSQKLRLAQYQSYIEHLKEMGMLFACKCSRKDILAINVDSRYPGPCRDKHFPFSQKLAWRVRVPEKETLRITDALSKQITSIHLDQVMPDFIVKLKNGHPSYQLVSLIDDECLGINYIVRGMDLLPSSAAQCWLSRHLGLHFHTKTQFHHHELLLDSNGQKMAKSAGSNSVRHLISQGMSSAELLTLCFHTLGIPDPEINKLKDLKDLKLYASLLV